MTGTSPVKSAAPALGRALKDWRRRRGLSQLGLALEAGVSQRHLGFIETGRSQPSREMVLLLARALRLPLREQNDLLEVAGYARVFVESALDVPALASVRQAIRLLLDHQEPFPAVVLDRRWFVRERNAGADRLFGWLLGSAANTPSANIVRALVDPALLRPHVANWHDVARSLLERIRAEAVGGVVDDETAQLEALLREQLAAAGMPERSARPPAPIQPVTFEKDGTRLAFFSTVTTIGTPRDVTLQELRIEHFFPADEETRASYLRKFVP